MSLVSDQIQNANFCNMFQDYSTKGLEERKEWPSSSDVGLQEKGIVLSYTAFIV